ncbi:unnamed protein product, partial [Iphiclides podalirius]
MRIAGLGAPSSRDATFYASRAALLTPLLVSARLTYAANAPNGRLGRKVVNGTTHGQRQNFFRSHCCALCLTISPFAYRTRRVRNARKGARAFLVAVSGLVCGVLHGPCYDTRLFGVKKRYRAVASRRRFLAPVPDTASRFYEATARGRLI